MDGNFKSLVGNPCRSGFHLSPDSSPSSVSSSGSICSPAWSSEAERAWGFAIVLLIGLEVEFRLARKPSVHGLPRAFDDRGRNERAEDFGDHFAGILAGLAGQLWGDQIFF
jgi:hypothetical protein